MVNCKKIKFNKYKWSGERSRTYQTQMEWNEMEWKLPDKNIKYASTSCSSCDLYIKYLCMVHHNLFTVASLLCINFFRSVSLFLSFVLTHSEISRFFPLALGLFRTTTWIKYNFARCCGSHLRKVKSFFLFQFSFSRSRNEWLNTSVWCKLLCMWMGLCACIQIYLYSFIVQCFSPALV